MSAQDATREQTDAALERGGVADMRPAYRVLLRRLKDRDPDGFEEATRRYEEELVPQVASGQVDAVQAWIAYGTWIAQRLTPGDRVAVDRSGRARPMGVDEPCEPDMLLLHLPGADAAPAIALAIPANPSAPQRATAELLVR